MEVVFLNNLINIVISLFLVSLVNSKPQDSYYFKNNIRFPSPYYSSEDFGIYDSDVSGDEKIVRSPTSNGWYSENQPSSQETHTMHSNSRSDLIRPQKAKGGPGVDDRIYFPGDTGIKNQRDKPVMPVPHVADGQPPCANGTSFCENADNYPRSILKNALQKDEMMFRTYFGRDVIPSNGSGVLNRIDTSGMTERSLCQVRERVIFPKMAENADGNWLFIANLDKYVQGVRVEECLQQPGTPCDAMATFPLGYIATCEQKYMYRKLVALNSSGQAVSDSFRLPACCNCRVILQGPGARSRGESHPEPLPLTIPGDSTTKSTQTVASKTKSQNNMNNRNLRKN